MKLQVTNYTFDKTAKTVTFTDYTTIRLDSILLITNVTDNVIVYNFADPLLGGTVATNVLTLTYDTSSMDNADKLQIFYDDPDVAPATVVNQETLEVLVGTLQELVARLAVIASMANAGAPALRVIPIASVSTAVTGSVTATVASTSITNFGTGVPAKEVADDINNMMITLANINNASAT
jgi:hypothetical protein